MLSFTHSASRMAVFMLLAFLFLALSGCATKKGTVPVVDASNASGTELAPPSDYTLKDFQDIPIPMDLDWDRDNSLSMRTASFVGGLLKFSGRVEGDSLADYFISALPKKGWKLAGSARYQDNLLAFSKPGKTCIINIVESGMFSKTEVYIYLTDNVSNRQEQGFRVPFGSETLQ